MIEGLDLSHWNGQVSAPGKMVAAGIRFVFHKVTEGAALSDEQAALNWPVLRGAGLLVGPYHFYRPEVNPILQARHFFAVSEALGLEGTLPPVVDFEVDGAELLHFKAHLEAVEERFDRRPILYTSVRYWFRSAPAWARFYRLWVASWYRSVPTLPRGFPRWDFHQYTARGDGKSLGVSSAFVDRNRFNGDEASLLALRQESAAPAQPLVTQARVNVARLMLRTDPWGEIVGEARRGSTWQVQRISYDEVGRPWFWVNGSACCAGWLCHVD